jgi:hypothetical protein
MGSVPGMLAYAAKISVLAVVLKLRLQTKSVGKHLELARDEIIGEFRAFHDEELCDIYRPHNIISTET